jgi:hypothetical protein
MSNWPDLGCLELAIVLKLETDLSPINHEFQITLLPLDGGGSGGGDYVITPSPSPSPARGEGYRLGS